MGLLKAYIMVREKIIRMNPEKYYNQDKYNYIVLYFLP